MRSIIVIACIAAASALAPQAAAQAYPDKPIRIVVPFPPGGSSDFSARILSAHLPHGLRQAVVIDNRGGAGGNIGNDIVAKASSDGYTLLVTAEGTITISPSIYAKLPYVALRDLTAITQIIKYSNVVVVNPSLRVNSVKELIVRAKEQPGKLSYGNPGVGTNPHLAGELFKLMSGVEIVSVSYKGGGPAMMGVIGNETQMSFATAPSAIPHVKTGRLNAIAVTSAKRSAALPDLPTISESGVPGYSVESWVGLLAPAQTPAKIIARLYEETAKILRMQEVKDVVLASGSETAGNPPHEANAMMRDETAMWSKLIKTVGVRAE